MPVLQVSELVKSYGSVRAVSGISFEVRSGEIYALLGPNGAGKTTTINIISTLLPADSGEVLVSGRSMRSADVRRQVGYVPQEVSLIDRLTARENLRFFGRLYDLRGRDLADRVERRLTQVGLSDRGSSLVKTFSGGMKRRLNIAAGLLHDPALLLLDEPTAGVDPQSRAHIFDVVEELAASGLGVVYTTHYMEEAERLCHRIGIVDHGKLLDEGTFAELVSRSEAMREVHLVADNIGDATLEEMAKELGTTSFQFDGERARFVVSRESNPLLDLVRAADRLKVEPKSIELREPNLETVFLALTGRELRD